MGDFGKVPKMRFHNALQLFSPLSPSKIEPWFLLIPSFYLPSPFGYIILPSESFQELITLPEYSIVTYCVDQ